MMQVHAITIDLDDTLWPVDPVIEAAEQALQCWLARQCPRVVDARDMDSMRALRHAIAAESPAIAHDLTELRRRALARAMVEEAGYTDTLVDEAMRVFLDHRNRVQLYPDALPFLEQASRRVPLLSISNGNADLERIGLSALFESHVNARAVGAAKPDVRVFRAACDLLDLRPGQVLHIGDHPVQDILGAAGAGMKTVWINRSGARWEEVHSADHEVSSLDQVLDLVRWHETGDPA